jgi:uncharacterized protein (TIGR03086 family)
MTHSPADRVRRLAARFDTVVTTLGETELAAPTPCTEWTVADVLVHVAATQHDFLVQRGLAATSESGPSSPQASARGSIAAMQAVVDNPDTASITYDGWFGPTTVAQTIDGFYALDLLVHAWDIAVAVGRPELAEADEVDVQIARDLLVPVGDVLRTPGVCGPALPAADNETAFRGFLAWLGRDPNWSPR